MASTCCIHARVLAVPAVVALVLTAVTLPAQAIQSYPGVGSGAVELPAVAERADRIASVAPAALAKATAWSDFIQLHPDWDVRWNLATGTPHRAFGAGIAVAGRVEDPAAAIEAARDFLRSQSPLTKAGAVQLVAQSAVRGGRVWYVHFQQRHQGIPVLLTDITVRLGVDGKVFAFGADTRDGIQLSTSPSLDAATARLRASDGLAPSSAADATEGGEQLYVLPLDFAAGTQYRLVRHVRVHRELPRHEWEVFVDAHSGEVVWRFDRVRHAAVGGTVTGLVHPQTPEDVAQTLPLQQLAVTVGGVAVQTDAAGIYTRSTTGLITVSAALRGRYADVNRQDGVADAALSVSGVNATAGQTVNFAFTDANSAQSERDAFYHTNVVHAYIKGLDAGFTSIDYIMPVAVNIADVCNAYWDGNGINFFAAGGGCNNTGSVSDVVYHEYGHGINDNLYVQLGSPFGMINGALHEGMADVTAAMLEDDPVIGQGFNVGGGNIRDLTGGNTWPRDFSGEVHTDGLMIAGAFWDLRQSVGLTVAEQLAHFSKYGLPDDSNLRLAFEEYFFETLVADDDDSNLANQTPHWNEILAAFNLHGIGPSLYVDVAHTELSDTADMANPYPVDAVITSSSSLFPVDAASPELVYTINSGAPTSLAMADLGGGLFRASIPAQPLGSLVRYHIRAAAVGGTALDTPVTPTVLPFAFLVGPVLQQVSQTFESANAAWSVNPDGTDNATTGVWVRLDPAGTNINGQPVQPESDHTPSGVACWVTGSGLSGEQPGVNDVDGGRTTLRGPTWNMGSMLHPVVRYWRWYTNNLGSEPNTDVWKTQISNDNGATWVDVENTNLSENAWSRVTFRVEDYVAPTATMRMRWIAEDALPGSLVEAGLDDVEVLSFDATGVDSPGLDRPSHYALAQNRPNPFNPATSIVFDLPRAGRATLRIYDLAGRLVATLADGALAAGRHTLRWDGRDAQGAAVASGVYLYRLESADFTATKRMVLAK